MNKNLSFSFVVIFVFLFSLLVPAQAQEQQSEAAAEKLADAAMPVTTLFETAPDCLAKASYVLPPKEAAKYCLAARKLEAHRAEVAANATAKTSQPKNPCSGVWGWLNCSVPVVVVPVRGGYRHEYSSQRREPRRSRERVSYGANGGVASQVYSNAPVATMTGVDGFSGSSGGGGNTNGFGTNR